jgi:hypothetical protein
MVLILESAENKYSFLTRLVTSCSNNDLKEEKRFISKQTSNLPTVKRVSRVIYSALDKFLNKCD